MWNDDYLEFLIRDVWKIRTPQRIVDFGCGYGYLGIKLMPLLPEGSTYTGIDIGEELICEARRLFKKAPFQSEFIVMDLEKYKPAMNFDIAICQAVLRHIPQAKTILEKMTCSVVPTGKVICIEVNRRMENAGYYIHDDQFNISENDYSLQNKWEQEFLNGGRDYLLGIKIPIYMKQLGLKDVGVRLNDFVDFVVPESDTNIHREQVATLCRGNGSFNLTGLDIENTYILQARSLLISYGTK